MSADDVLPILDAEVAEFPERAPAEELCDIMNSVAARYADTQRPGLLSALLNWLQLRSEPKTMLALDIAGNLQLSELRDEIEKLLHDVERGPAFMPFYSAPIRRVLDRL